MSSTIASSSSSSGGPLLASVSKGSVKLWAWNETTKEFSLVGSQTCNGSTYKSVSWNHSNQVLIVDDEQQAKVFLLVVTNGQLYPPQSLSDNQPARSSAHIGCIAISNNSRYLAVSGGTSIQLWDMKRRNVKLVFEGHSAPLTALQFNANGDLYSADITGVINLWSTKSVDPIQVISEGVDDSSVRLTCMQLAPSNSLLVAGYSDGTVRVWDFADGRLQQTQEQKLHNGAVKGLSCSPRNNKLVATIGEDEKLLLFDTSSSRKAKDVVASIHVKKALTTVAFHENGMQASVGTEDGMLLMYDWRNVKSPVFSIEAHDGHPVHAVAYQAPKAAPRGTDAPSSNYTPSTTSSMTPKSSVDPPSASKQPLSSNTTTGHHNTSSPEKSLPVASLSSSMREVTPSKKVVGSNGIKYEVSPMLLEKKHLAQPDSKPAPAVDVGSVSSATFSSPPNVAKSSTFSSLRDTSEITQRVNNLITDYENSLRAVATTSLDSPRTAIVEPSRNRYATSTTLSNDFEATIKPATSEPRMSADNNNASFSSQYSQRVKDLIEVGGYPKQNLSLATTSEAPTSSKQTSSSHYYQPQSDRLNSSRDSLLLHHKADTQAEDEFADLRQAVKPVTTVELEEALELLKYDIHREVQDIIREQVRQFAMAKEDTTNLIREMSNQLAELLQANRELREENEQLRKIY